VETSVLTGFTEENADGTRRGWQVAVQCGPLLIRD
jgi:hypothetical protein